MNGLVLAGGLSKRMGTDKAFMVYHEKPQYLYLHALLSDYCDEVFVSCNASQAEIIQIPKLIDKEPDKGPLSGIKMSFEAAVTDWLIVPCDMPGINTHILNRVIQQHQSGDSDVTCMIDENGRINPLLGIYNRTCYDKLMKYAGDSPTEFIRDLNAQFVTFQLANINTPQDFNNHRS